MLFIHEDLYSSRGRHILNCLPLPLRGTIILVPSYFMREWREKRTYKTQLILGLTSSAIGFIQFALMGVFLSTGGHFPSLDMYGGNIVGFLITGSIGSSALILLMNSPKKTIQEEQNKGTLEVIVGSTLGLSSLVGARMLVTAISILISGSFVVFLFFMAFGVSPGIDLVGLLVTLIIGSALMFSIGLCAAGYILVSKSGEPFTWVVITIMTLFSGVMFPVEMYPDWLASIAQLLPTTAIMTCLRQTTMVGISTVQVWNSLLPAVIAVCIVGPCGFLTYNWGMRQARLRGTIGQY